MLRSITCILIVLMLITETFFDTNHTIFCVNIFKFWGSDVDIFFILSGFIITYSNWKYFSNTSSTGKFRKRV